MRTIPLLPTSKRGASFTEYMVLLALVGVLAIPALVLLGPSVSETFATTETRLSDASDSTQEAAPPTSGFDVDALPEQTVISGTYPSFGSYPLLLDGINTVTPLGFSRDLTSFLPGTGPASWSMTTIEGQPLPGLTLNPTTGVLAVTDSSSAPYTVSNDSAERYVVLRISATRNGVTSVGDFVVLYIVVV